MSWHYSQVLVEEFLALNYLDGESCVQLNGMRTAERSYFDGRKKGFSKRSQSGTTLEHSMASRGVGRWMSSLAASPVKTLVLQIETQQELQESGQDYGSQCIESFAKWHHDTSLWKTQQLSLFGGLEQFSEIWPTQGIILDGYALNVQILVGLITETESGYMPTPRASMGNCAKNRCGVNSEEYRHNLEEYLGGKPNPIFCEWMMGWPLGWADTTKLLGMDKYQEWLERHGRF